MAHLKRQSVPKNWPIERKGTTFVVKPTSKKGIPILVVLRDLLKIAQTRKEVKRAIHRRHLLVNNKNVKDEKRSMSLFDTLSLVPSKKHYLVSLSDKGNIMMEEISEKDANKKIAKVIDKRILKKKKIQLNLSDGGNILSEIKCNTNDSVLLNLQERKIEKCLPLKEGSEVIVFAGKHSGKRGQIKEINKEKKMAIVSHEKGKLNILIKQLMVVE